MTPTLESGDALDEAWARNAHDLEWSLQHTLDHFVGALVTYAGDLAINARQSHPGLRPQWPEQPIERLLGSRSVVGARLTEACTAAVVDARGIHPGGIAEWV